jgi:hypothetical protein
MKGQLTFVIFILMVLLVHAQDETHNISQQEAKNLLRSPNQKNPDSAEIDHLLRLELVFEPDALNDPDNFSKSPERKEIYV